MQTAIDHLGIKRPTTVKRKPKKSRALILNFLIQKDADKNEIYGNELIKKLELSAGTVYSILSKLENENIIEGHWKIPTEQTEGKTQRPRRMVKLTNYGKNVALDELAYYSNRNQKELKIATI